MNENEYKSFIKLCIDNGYKKYLKGSEGVSEKGY